MSEDEALNGQETPLYGMHVHLSNREARAAKPYHGESRYKGDADALERELLRDPDAMWMMACRAMKKVVFSTTVQPKVEVEYQPWCVSRDYDF